MKKEKLVSVEVCKNCRLHYREVNALRLAAERAVQAYGTYDLEDCINELRKLAREEPEP